MKKKNSSEFGVRSSEVSGCGSLISELRTPNSSLPTSNSPIPKLVKGLFWILLANLIVKPLWLLGIEVGVQNAVGDQAYGFYFTIFNLSYIFNILLDLGVTNFNTRNIARHPQLVRKHMSGILALKLALLALYLVVTFTVGLLMGYGSHEFRLLAWLCLAQFLNSLILYLRSNFEGLMLFRWDSLFSVLDRVLMIIICGLLLCGSKFSIFNFQFSIFHFVYAQVFAYAATALLALAVIGRRSEVRVRSFPGAAAAITPNAERRTPNSPLRLSWNWPFFLVVLRKSAPFALLVLLMASYNRIDPILLRSMVGDAAAGVYAGAFRLLDALTMVAYLVSVPLLPVFSRICKEYSGLTAPSSQLADTVRLVFPALMAFAIGAAVTFSAMGDELMRLFYGARSEAYVPVFRLLVFGIIPIGVTYVFGTLLTAAGSLRQLNIFAAMSLVLNVVLNLVLIPRLGAVGSACASLGAQSFMAAMQLAVACRSFRLPVVAFRLPQLIAYVVAMVALNWLCHSLELAWWLWLAIAVGVAVALAVLLRIVDVRGLLSMLGK